MSEPPQSTTPRSNATSGRLISSLEGEDSGEPDPLEPFSTLGVHSDEISLIRSFTKSFYDVKSQYATPDYSDDCAVFMPPRDRTLLITTDALAQGVHFDLHWDSLKEIGVQAAVVNLSDLAASGAEPLALLWSLSIPKTMQLEDLGQLAEGFALISSLTECPVIGGNVLSRDGGLEIHVTAIGAAYHTPITRRGAQPGDYVYVTGELGLRALGYLYPSRESRTLRHQWRPHLAESRTLSLWGEVTAMIDVSDGLIIDASRLAESSQVMIELDTSIIPTPNEERLNVLPQALSLENIRKAALYGGEDYVLLFTAPADCPPPQEVNAIKIGRCSVLQADQSNFFVKLDGEALSHDQVQGTGYLHRFEGLR